MSSGRRHKRVEDLEGPQRAAAMALGNVVVAAGAGSGKTTVLAARYVRLLETGRMPPAPGEGAPGERVHARNVLVLTFTKKAAAEMYSRIYGALAEAEAAAKAAAEADPGLAAHLASCLADFSQAQISTFDSFASRIARSGCPRFGVAPDFAVDEDRARELAGELALSFLLERREDEAVRDLVSASGLGGARSEVLAELAVRKMSLSSPPDFAAFHALQGARLETMAAEAREGLLALRAAALDYSGSKTTPTSQAWLDALEKGPGEGEEGLAAFAASLEGLRKPASNSRDEASLFLSGCVPDIRKAAETCRDIAATRRAHPGRLGLYRLLDEFRLSWDRIRRAEKTLTFRDVAQLALDVLESAPETRRHYRNLYRYVMIDEFQDDDELQKRVLFLLAGADSGSASIEGERGEPSRGQAFGLADDKLFFVGDEKQSIYLFRGADVSIFRRLPGELASLGSAPDGRSEALPLSRNFRSEPGVIDMINAIFPSVMAPREGRDALEDFEARFERLESRPATPGVEPLLVYLELPRSRADVASDDDEGESLRSAAEAEAWEVARIVRDAVEGGALLVADRKSGTARPARYEDFAVLLRSTGNQVHFEKYFRLFDVPYGSENACGLFSEAVACDLYYALRLALYRDDRNALAAYLRSPFAGLSDEALVGLLTARDGEAAEPNAGPPGPPEPFDPFGPEAEGLIPEGERRGWARAALTQRTLRSMAGRAPIAACLSYLWFEAGYRAALLRDPVASAFEEHFELVHTMAAASDARAMSLAAFVARLEALAGKPDKLEVELPRDSARGVRIMTIHKSKGLEFPVVILPQANNVGRESGAGEAWYWEEGLGPTFKPPADLGIKSRNAFFEYAKERRTAKEGAEIKRLLYVALTRAESHIIVTAVEPRAADARRRSFRSLIAEPLGLFAPPSPLAPGAPPAAAALPPFGALSRLPSGAWAGAIPERGDFEYWQLVAGAKRRADSGSRREPAEELPGLTRFDRRAWPLSASVSSIAERYAERYAARDAEGSAGSAAAASEALDIKPELDSPRGLSADTWGSLVHAILESRLAPMKGAPRLPPALEDALEDALGTEGAIAEAKARAARLAQVFLGSELGLRAQRASERFVELKVAIRLDREATRRAPSRAKGSIDLAFIEGDRVVVVDYKTDSSIAAGSHELQLAAYRRAAAEIFGLVAEAWIFYLYGGGRAIRVDEGGSVPRLEDAPDPQSNFSRTFGESLEFE